MSTINLVQQLEEEKKRIKESIPFKKGDILQWVNDKKETKVGTVDYIYVYDNLDVLMGINLPVTYLIRWSGSIASFKNPNFSTFTKIENPLNEDALSRIDDLIYQKEKEIKRATELLEKQMRRLNRIKQNIQSKCIHDWDKGQETGEIEKHMIGETEVKIYTCQRCYKEVKSA